MALAQWHEQEERQSETCDDILWCYSSATTLVLLVWCWCYFGANLVLLLWLRHYSGATTLVHDFIQSSGFATTVRT